MELEAASEVPKLTRRAGKDGKVYNTANIGGKAQEPVAYEADSEDEDEDEEEYEEEEGDICPGWPPMVLVCTLFAGHSFILPKTSPPRIAPRAFRRPWSCFYTPPQQPLGSRCGRRP